MSHFSSYVFNNNHLFKKILATKTGIKYMPSLFDIWILGITIIIGGHFFDWNYGLRHGFWYFAVALFMIGNKL